MFSACMFSVSGMHATQAPLHVSHMPLSCVFHVLPLHVVRVPSHTCHMTITPLFCILLVPSRSWSVRPIPVWGARVPRIPPRVLPAHKLHEHAACRCPRNGDPWAHVVPAGHLSLGVLGVREPARGFLPWGSCCGAPSRCSRATLGLCFLSVHPDRHSRLQTLGTSCPLPPPLTFWTAQTRWTPNTHLHSWPQQQASGTSPLPATRRPSADLAGTGLKSLPRSAHSTASHCSGLWMAHPASLLPRQCPRGLFSRTPTVVPFTPEMRVSHVVFRCGLRAPASRVSSP